MDHTHVLVFSTFTSTLLEYTLMQPALVAAKGSRQPAACWPPASLPLCLTYTLPPQLRHHGSPQVALACGGGRSSALALMTAP